MGPMKRELRAAPPRPGAQVGARTRRPSRLRVVATVSADVAALLTAALLAVWIASSFDDVPLLHRIDGAFDSDPKLGLIVLVLLTPYFVAALWVYGLYREPARSVGGFNLGEGLAGLTALTAASWVLLIVFVLDARARRRRSHPSSPTGSSRS